MGALDVNKVVNKHQSWRLISCIWLHAGVFHVLANMLSLVFIGIRLEQEFGFGMHLVFHIHVSSWMYMYQFLHHLKLFFNNGNACIWMCLMKLKSTCQTKTWIFTCMIGSAPIRSSDISPSLLSEKFRRTLWILEKMWRWWVCCHVGYFSHICKHTRRL